MTKYAITAHGQHYGTYEGETPDEALDAMVEDAGGLPDNMTRDAFRVQESITFTVYENNKVDQPREVGVGEAADLVEESDMNRYWPLDRQINLVLAKIGSFDPNTEEYRDFVQAVADDLVDRDG